MRRLVRSFITVATCMVLPSAAFSQITLTTSDLANLFGAGISANTYQNFDSVETMNVGSPSGSSPQSWTLPLFVVSDSSRVDNVLPSSTPYAANFSGATYAETFSESDSGISLLYFAYLRVSNDSLYTMGTAEHVTGSSGGHAIDSTIIMHQTKFVFHLPISLGTVVAGMPDTNSLGPGVYETITSSSTYDAYGTLNLPNGSFQALRSVQSTTFKTYNGGSLVYSSTSYSIVWNTVQGHQLTVGIDSGATSGSVSVKSISWTRMSQTPTAVKMMTEQPAGFMLAQNYPNPFNPTTVISYSLPSAGRINLRVYDLLGREVATLVDGQTEAGVHEVSFDASRLPSGTYFYQLRAGSLVASKKLVYLK